MGEHDLSKDIDCFTAGGKVCADPHVDYAINHTLIHPKYEARKLANDIALIKIKQKVTFTGKVPKHFFYSSQVKKC